MSALDPQPSRRDALADELAAHLRERVSAIVEALSDQIGSDVPSAIGWTPGQRDRIRRALEELVTGFLRYLHIGDLEATECERLRELGATPLPGVPQEGGSELVRALRSTLHVTAVELVPDLGLEHQRILRTDLEGYLALIGPSGRLGEVGELDPWLARIASAGRDIEDERPEGTGP